ncbi:putative Uncharacterized CDP-alcohol phosphatidyltransferase class-I family protein C22A12.08c [Glarea lozoyensis 74030]|uniref:Putative Uncharacterized CDP-alcohol phosphatidyltransferase class-I family protein C22A12.08c n=1 Tax=Glarea lozoyensis (strain ATCC 74030 / MF5533) TaxID=1104152 RepID=H0ECC7_GLAL7|nr:putative Uncharacterized CDP-alcohol phosphatidyltransferase class-I family protein C22A12.08c [Glarea lozoyensis 74030]
MVFDEVDTVKPREEVRDLENPVPKEKKPLLKALKELTPHENIYTVPNILTATRLIAAPVIGYLVLHDYHAWAVGLFAYAGITDLVDGWIARKWKLQTVVGTVIDPMADKTLMTILTVCLAVKGALPGIFTLVNPQFIQLDSSTLIGFIHLNFLFPSAASFAFESVLAQKFVSSQYDYAYISS